MQGFGGECESPSGKVPQRITANTVQTNKKKSVKCCRANSTSGQNITHYMRAGKIKRCFLSAINPILALNIEE